MEYQEAKEKIIDSMHWKELAFIGQLDNAVFEGCLTQASEEILTDQFLFIIFTPAEIEAWKKGGYPAMGRKTKRNPKIHT